MSFSHLSRSLCRPVSRAAIRATARSTTHIQHQLQLQQKMHQPTLTCGCGTMQQRFFSHHGDHGAEQKEFINAAFELFDENQDGVLVWSELELA